MKSIGQISIITGANRGFGKSIASCLVNLSSQTTIEAIGSVQLKNLIILVARDEAQVSKVRDALISEDTNQNCQIKAVSGVELSDLAGLQAKMEQITSIVQEFAASKDFKECSEKRIVLFNNAGTLGDISRKAVQMKPQEVSDYSTVNFASFSYFCAEFKKWQAFGSFDVAQIVNTSSLAAIKAFAFNSLYCSVKAARDMYMQVLALEEPSIKTLNYAPGPMDNDMQADIRQNSGDLETKAYFQSLFDEKKLVKMEDSVAKMLHIALTNSFTSGAHIDFYDYENRVPLLEK
ncbi:hypothetical protein DSO57_1036650 [Entomophthora muscae]|uniref:Uncharacterized protein n=1 Tax=Entomophthora muscae TaxID=34485 RepID=A0ACC2SZC2_9FUNG|nr:hypothetical protein DSO57_1036650 [Entomophthora muscae]